jgi:16S rRNA A1518/A1519 N6-dimethyltransferase RsmA/KsgA/DIM1 with predicted DNA glycosylase/AP lyase activity
MDVDLQLFKNIIKEGRHNSDLLDSYSPNQFKSKEVLINHINNLNILDETSEIIILGSWYGSILIPAFKKVKKITAIDIDDKVIRIAKNRLFNHYKNVDYWNEDVFEIKSDIFKKSNLIINTSCEHMKPMNELELNTNAHFAFQSNDMFDIEGHINCVSNIEEFKSQLPDNAKVLIEDEITDERGIRFLLIGKYE